jgi:hypothetical protein
MEAHAIEHPKCPVTEDYVRMNLWPSGWVIEPWKKVTIFQLINSKGPE